MVVSESPFLIVAGRRTARRVPLKHNGQRSFTLAVQDYESSALPLSYGGDGP